MGAQAAALLAAGGPLGDLPGKGAYDAAGRLQLAAPPGYPLARTALAHGGVGLAPTAWDGRRLHLRLLSGGEVSQVCVEPDLQVRWRGGPPDVAVLRRVLALDDDVEQLWQATDAVPSLRWVRAVGAGRVLRSPTVWQDLVGCLAGTRASYRRTQDMLRTLVGDGPFPAPEQVLARPVEGWGHRTPFVKGLAERVAGGLDVERWRDPAVPDAQVAAAVRELPGFGTFATAQLMPLLGRPRPLVLDGWLRSCLGGLSDEAVAERYAPMARWAGTGAWLAACTWLAASPAPG